MTDETIDVGARVRFKGDHSSNPLWMTVTRRDVNPRGNDGQVIAGTFLQLMWTVAGNEDWARRNVQTDVRRVDSIMEGAVTTKPHAPADMKATPPKKRRTR